MSDKPDRAQEYEQQIRAATCAHCKEGYPVLVDEGGEYHEDEDVGRATCCSAWDEILPILRAALAEPKPNVARLAERILCEWGDHKAVMGRTERKTRLIAILTKHLETPDGTQALASSSYMHGTIVTYPPPVPASPVDCEGCKSGIPLERGNHVERSRTGEILSGQPCIQNASPVDVEMPSLTFASLRSANLSRCSRWHPRGLNEWSLSDWGIATAGEMGEALNIIKKLNRERDGIAGNSLSESQLRAELADELADVAIYLDILAASQNIDLSAAVISKFNRTSEKVGFPERLNALAGQEQQITNLVKFHEHDTDVYAQRIVDLRAQLAQQEQRRCTDANADAIFKRAIACGEARRELELQVQRLEAQLAINPACGHEPKHKMADWVKVECPGASCTQGFPPIHNHGYCRACAELQSAKEQAYKARHIASGA